MTGDQKKMSEWQTLRQFKNAEEWEIDALLEAEGIDPDKTVKRIRNRIKQSQMATGKRRGVSISKSASRSVLEPDPFNQDPETVSDVINEDEDAYSYEYIYDVAASSGQIPELVSLLEKTEYIINMDIETNHIVYVSETSDERVLIDGNLTVEMKKFIIFDRFRFEIRNSIEFPGYWEIIGCNFGALKKIAKMQGGREKTVAGELSNA